jgi:Exopolysaccharide biosynthesis protein YbjH
MSNLLRRLATVSTLPLLAAGASCALASENPRYRTTQHDFGGVGLLQTPTARMAPAGEFSFNANRTSPYSRYSISVQPLPWLESTIRYIAISNINYGDEGFSDQSLKDKAIDAKFRLWQESRWLPQVALGFRDIGGTGLFSSEFIVANKRFYDLDFSLGVAWGYIGNRGDFGNPLSLISDSFDDRARNDDPGGTLNTSSYFSGRPALFGGIEYQTPWDNVRLKLEVEGNDYQSEPFRNNQAQDHPVNLGVLYSLGSNVDLTAAWERGNTAMFGITLRSNVKSVQRPPKLLDPAPEPRRPLPAGVSGADVDWANISQRLEDNAGIAVESIAVNGDEVVITGQQTTYPSDAEGMSRAARVLDNSLGEGSYDWYTLVHKPYGMALNQTSVNAQTLREYERFETDRRALRYGMENAVPSVRQGGEVYNGELDRANAGLALGYRQNVGGPDSFILYQFLLRANGQFYLDRNKWLDGTVGINLLNNYDKFEYDGPSNLPRVRTDLRQYLTSSDVQLNRLQYTQTEQINRDWFGMAYAGLLEDMYGGIGAEVLYRPHGVDWAVGVDVNWVKQRGYRQDFSFRDYSTLTGHVTGYLRTGFHDVLIKGSVGRYLAGDIGGTIDLSRRFRNGFEFGGWATFTDVSKEEFGEGSFDKGVYLRVPFDAFFLSSTKSVGTLSWNPLTRDGGAKLWRNYELYRLTQDRDLDRFDNSFQNLTR